MLIDCHVHLNNYYTEEGKHPRPTKENVDLLFQEMEAHGVDHAVVLTSYLVNVSRPAVEELLEYLAEDGRVTIVEGLRWRSENRTDLFLMEERIQHGLVKGIKLYPGYDRYAIDDPSLEAVFRIAAKHDVPVMIHCGDTFAEGAKVRMAHPLLVDDVAIDFPDVRFVICHLGNPWFVDAAEVLYKNDNVYADVSGLALEEPGEAYMRPGRRHPAPGRLHGQPRIEAHVRHGLALGGHGHVQAALRPAGAPREGDGRDPVEDRASEVFGIDVSSAGS